MTTITIRGNTFSTRPGNAVLVEGPDARAICRTPITTKELDDQRDMREEAVSALQDAACDPHLCAMQWDFE